MSIVISDLKDALVNSGIKNKMLAKGGSLAIKLNDSNVCIISLKNSESFSSQYFIYKVQVYQTGNTLEENLIKIPRFYLKTIPQKDVYIYNGNFQSGICGENGCYQYESVDGRSGSHEYIYESQDLLELIPGVIEDLVEVINFYNGD